MKGDMKATFQQVDTDGSGHIDKKELKEVLQKLGGAVSDEEVNACFEELDEDGNGQIDIKEFSSWYMKSETKIKKDVTGLFKRFDKNGDGNIELKELEALITACNGEDAPPPTAEDVEAARKELDANGDGQISREEFMDWYKKSMFFEKKRENMKETVERQESDEEEGISLEFPQSWKGRIFYIIWKRESRWNSHKVGKDAFSISLPLRLCFLCTLRFPICGNPNGSHIGRLPF